MNCRRVDLDGQTVIMCGHFHDPVPSCQCGAPGEILCDWILSKGAAHSPGRTCDRRLCEKHAQQVGPDKHLCAEHQAAYAQWKAQREKRPQGGAS